MIPEIGQFALILALILALTQATMPLIRWEVTVARPRLASRAQGKRSTCPETNKFAMVPRQRLSEARVICEFARASGQFQIGKVFRLTKWGWKNLAHRALCMVRGRCRLLGSKPAGRRHPNTFASVALNSRALFISAPRGTAESGRGIPGDSGPAKKIGPGHFGHKHVDEFGSGSAVAPNERAPARVNQPGPG